MFLPLLVVSVAVVVVVPVVVVLVAVVLLTVVVVAVVPVSVVVEVNVYVSVSVEVVEVVTVVIKLNGCGSILAMSATTFIKYLTSYDFSTATILSSLPLSVHGPGSHCGQSHWSFSKRISFRMAS